MPQSRIIHANDSPPGTTRRALKRGWAYFDSQGQRITDRDEIDRPHRAKRRNMPPPTGASARPPCANAMGRDFTAKHFRTWGASAIAFEALAGGTVSLQQMIAPVAGALGKTPAISLKSHIHPALIELCRNGQDDWRQGLRLPRATRYLSRTECGLIAFLEEMSGSTTLPLAA